MGINLVIAVTDGDWFEMLRRQPDLSEVTREIGDERLLRNR